MLVKLLEHAVNYNLKDIEWIIYLIIVWINRYKFGVFWELLIIKVFLFLIVYSYLLLN